MKVLFRSAPLLLLLLAACASTPEPTPQAAAEPKTEQTFRTVSEAESVAEDDDLICRNETKVGTRFETKRCATRAEWERIRQASTEDYRRAAQRGHSIKPGS